MIKEIGSEFYDIPTYYGGEVSLLPSSLNAYFLSGRTALNAIVLDAIDTYSITSALLPSYCCDSMIIPFLKHGINVRFYDIIVDSSGHLFANIPSPLQDEIIYVMKYFGDTSLSIDSSEWAVSIEDLTHIAFDECYKTDCTYSYTSYRKWFAVDGIATAYKNGTPLTVNNGVFTNEKYIKLRNKGFSLKKKYMSGEDIDKSVFLGSFSEAEELLDEVYENYNATSDSITALKGALKGKDSITTARRSNSKVLMDGLKDIPEITVFCNFNNPDNCPLFVPIIVDSSIRDSLRKHLIQNSIYCPVHWPLTSQHNGTSDAAKQIYQQELSLICDQRYNSSDMERITHVIKEFFTR